MKLVHAKIAMLITLLLSAIFFTNDFGLIDIEKTAIVTAIAIDQTDDEYSVSMEIAVPESNKLAENKKALLSGKGKTVSGAIRDMGDTSGWYPKLYFCNLIILGQSVAQNNVIKVLDYFAKTLRIQDSATVVLAENTAKELLESTSPLDNISSFALQKILLKNPGFDNDVANIDVKTFCADYYSKNASSLMPKVSIIRQENTDNSNQTTKDESTKTGGNTVFNATKTALFKNGKLVGELNENQTFIYNLIMHPSKETALKVNGVDEAGEKTDYLLTVVDNKRKISLGADRYNLDLNISLNLFCRIADQNSKQSKTTYTENEYMDIKIIKKAEEQLYNDINSLIEVSKTSGCDFLRVNDLLYRYCHKYYPVYKDSYLSVFTPKISVSVSGQK